MNRRDLLRILPAVFGVPAAIKAEEPKISKPEPSSWSEMVCQNVGHRAWHITTDGTYVEGQRISLPCGQRFKFLRVSVTPYCPKCGWAQDMSRSEELREKISGIPIESE